MDKFKKSFTGEQKMGARAEEKYFFNKEGVFCLLFFVDSVLPSPIEKSVSIRLGKFCRYPVQMLPINYNSK